MKEKLKNIFGKIFSKEGLMVLIPSAVALISVCVSILVILFHEAESTITPDYAPRELEQNAEPIGDEGDEKLEQPAGGGAVGIIYSTEVTVDLEQKRATLMFANPSKSNQDMVVQLVARDTVIIQSGRLTPGNRVTALDLLKGAEKNLAAGGCEGKLVILFYQQDTGEKAVLNTEIPVTVTIK